MTAIIEIVDVHAGPEVAWAALVDVERWPAWSPGTRSIVRRDSGPFGPRSSARVTMRGARGSIWQVTAFDPGRSFTWESTPMPGLRVVAVHAVEATPSGARVTLTLDLTGVSARIFRPLLEPFSRRNVQREAQGLRLYCESPSPPDSDAGG